MDADPAQSFARHTVDMCSTMAQRVMDLRDSLTPEEERRRFADVRMEELTTDPIAVVKRIYQQFELPFTPEFEAALVAYVAEHGNRKGGASSSGKPRDPNAHQRSLALLGISEEEIDRKFGRYRQRYLS